MKGRRKAIDHFFDALTIKVTVLSIGIWMLAAAVTGAVTYLFWRRGKLKLSSAILLPILVFYLLFALAVTLTERIPTGKAKYNLELFWSYRAIASGSTGLIGEIFWNVVLFVPIGLIVSALLRRRRWLSVAIGILFSAGIEITQLLIHLGFFEWDDMVHNGLGALIGFLLFSLLNKQGRRERKKKPSSV